MPPHELLTVPQVAALCKVGSTAIRQAIALGHLKPAFTSRGPRRTRYLMTLDDVRAYQAWRTAQYGEEFAPLLVKVSS